MRNGPPRPAGTPPKEGSIYFTAYVTSKVGSIHFTVHTAPVNGNIYFTIPTNDNEPIPSYPLAFPPKEEMPSQKNSPPLEGWQAKPDGVVNA